METKENNKKYYKNMNCLNCYSEVKDNRMFCDEICWKDYVGDSQ